MQENKIYENIEYVNLENYLTSEKFRVVPGECKDIPGGISEIPVVIDVKKQFSDSLGFDVSRSGRIYGWIRTCEEDILRKIEAKKIELIDWKEKFLMLILIGKEEKKTFFVNNAAVRKLLKECRKPPKKEV